MHGLKKIILQLKTILGPWLIMIKKVRLLKKCIRMCERPEYQMSPKMLHCDYMKNIIFHTVLPERNEAIGRMKSNGSTVRYLKNNLGTLRLLSSLLCNSSFSLRENWRRLN